MNINSNIYKKYNTKSIGITGGVGAGKTEVLKYIEQSCRCVILIADKLAYELESPGGECYSEVVQILGEDVLESDGYINRSKMAQKIFQDKALLHRINSVLHPAVKKYIIKCIEEEKLSGEAEFVFVEAALLIEEGYGEILDELWYIRVSPEERRRRLKLSRGYSDEKIDLILKAQLTDEEFMNSCQVIIDNSGDFESTKNQIDEALGKYGD